MINEGATAELVAFDGHTNTNGYMLDNSAADPNAGSSSHGPRQRHQDDHGVLQVAGATGEVGSGPPLP